LSIESFILGSMIIFFGVFNFISYMRDYEDEEINYEYYESSSLEEETEKVRVVPIHHKGKRLK